MTRQRIEEKLRYLRQLAAVMHHAIQSDNLEPVMSAGETAEYHRGLATIRAGAEEVVQLLEKGLARLK